MVTLSIAKFRHVAFLLTIGMLATACSTTPERLMFDMPGALTSPTTAPVDQKTWPAPPSVPRYAYIGDLRGESNRHQDGKDKQGLMSRFFAALVGLGNEAVPLTDLLRPQHGVVAPNGKIYVSDPGRRAVFVFDELNSEFAIWNESNLDIPFMSPISIALAGEEILVSDSEQGLIFVFNEQGQIVGRIGENLLDRPTGLAYDPQRQRIIVSDTDTDSLKIFNRNGELIDTLGAPGTGPGQFNRPTFLQYHDNRLYVTDSLNARIQVIDQDNDSIQIIGHRGLYVGNFSRPKGVAVDSDGNVYITESYYDHLLIFNPQGDLLMAIGGSGQQPGQFAQPTGIWIDPRDRLFVSDMLNGRVSIFQYLGGNL